MRLEIGSNPLPVCTRPAGAALGAADVTGAFTRRSTLFADPNLGRDATYEPADGDPFPVRVISRRADAITDFGGLTRSLART